MNDPYEILEKYQLKMPQKLYATNVEYADICDAVGIELLFKTVSCYSDRKILSYSCTNVN